MKKDFLTLFFRDSLKIDKQEISKRVIKLYFI